MSQRKIIKIRSTIDTIDRQIIRLLGLRKKQVLKIAKYKNKRTIVDKKRISQIMKRIKAESKKNKIDFILVKNFWNKLIQYSIKLEKKNSKITTICYVEEVFFPQTIHVCVSRDCTF